MVFIVCLEKIPSHLSLLWLQTLWKKPVFCQASLVYAWQSFDHFSVSVPVFMALRIIQGPYQRWHRLRMRCKLIFLDRCWILDVTWFALCFIHRTNFQEKNALVGQAVLLSPSFQSLSLSLPSWILSYPTKIITLKLVRWLWCSRRRVRWVPRVGRWMHSSEAEQCLNFSFNKGHSERRVPSCTRSTCKSFHTQWSVCVSRLSLQKVSCKFQGK